MKNVTVVDYGLCNLRSVTRAFEHCGAQVEVTDSCDVIREASYLVLPGVGAFADGMAGLERRHLVEALRTYATTERPFLGICLGMQMMLDCTEEFGVHRGLGMIPGKVVAVPATGADGTPHKIPHIGWNELVMPEGRQGWEGTVLEGVRPGGAVYFVHSFMAVPDDAADYLAVCQYTGRTITAAIQRGSLQGCQFHPEKSAHEGLRVLRRFLES